MQKRKNKAIEEEEIQEQAEQIQDNEQEFHPVEMLQDSGIANNDIKKLIDAGLYSLESIAYTQKKI